MSHSLQSMGAHSLNAPWAVIGALLCIGISPAGIGGGSDPPSAAAPRGSRAMAANLDLSRYAPGGGIVFTQIPLARVAGATAFAAEMLRASYGAGGRLVVLTKDGSTRVLTADLESAADPAISFDGKRILDRKSTR